MPAARARGLLPAMDAHERPVLLVERMFARGVLRAYGLDRLRERRSHRVVKCAAFVWFQRARAAQWTDPRREQDLIGIRVADAGDECLISKRVLDLAAMSLETAL